MPSASFTVTEQTLFTIPPVTPERLRIIGAAIVELQNKRAAACINLNDQPAKPYSRHGPIYIPVSGVGTIIRGPAGFSSSRAATRLLLKNLSPEKLKIFTEKRNKTSLGGREVFTKADITKLRAKGVIAGRGVKGTTPLGSVTPSGKSVKFANYSDYKKALGKTGNRDLELSGRMRGAMSIVEITANSVTVGFTRESERHKAEWNQALDPWFGLSAADRAYLTQLFANG